MSQIYKTSSGGGGGGANTFPANSGSSTEVGGSENIFGNNTANNGFATWTIGSGNTTQVNSYGTAKWIVNPIAGVGTHQTISAALASASSGDTIFVTDGIYTENPTMVAGVNICAYDTSGATPNVTILGNVTASYNGNASISGINLKTNGAACLTVSGASSSSLNLINCYIDANNATAISVNAANFQVKFYRCHLVSESNNALFVITNTIGIDFSYCYLTAGSAASTIAGGAVDFFNCKCQVFSLTTSSSGFFTAYNTFFDNSNVNQTVFTLAGTGNGTIADCALYSGSASTLSIGSGTTVSVTTSTINSSNTNAITGSGTVNVTGISFSGTSSTINSSLSINQLAFYPSTSITTTQYALQVGGAGNTLVSIANGASGTLWQSAGASANGGYTTATYPSTATGTGTILRADGTNWVASTATYPNTATGTGTILRADGTNWSATTSTYPNTNAKGDLLYGSASNVISDLAVGTYYGAPLLANDQGIPAWASPRNYVWLYDEFMTGNTVASQLNWTLQVANSGNSTLNASTATLANPGVFYLNTQTNTAGASAIKLAQPNGNCGCILLGGGFISTVFYCKLPVLSNGTDTYLVTLGLIDVSSNLTTISDGVYFTYSDSGSSPDWVANCTKASSTTSTTSNLAADTSWHRYRIDINAAGSSVAFYVDDVALNISPLTTNIPTLQIAPVLIIQKSAGTTSRSLAIDYFSFYQNLTTSR